MQGYLSLCQMASDGHVFLTDHSSCLFLLFLFIPVVCVLLLFYFIHIQVRES